MADEKTPFYQDGSHGDGPVSHSHVCVECNAEFSHAHPIRAYASGRHPNVCTGCHRMHYASVVRKVFYAAILLGGLLAVCLGVVCLVKAGAFAGRAEHAIEGTLVDVGRTVEEAGQEWKNLARLTNLGGHIVVNSTEAVVDAMEKHAVPIAHQVAIAAGGLFDVGETVVEGVADAAVATAFQLRMALWAFECYFRIKKGCAQDYAKKFGYCRAEVKPMGNGQHSVTHHNCTVMPSDFEDSHHWLLTAHKSSYLAVCHRMVTTNFTDFEKYRPDLSNQILNGHNQACNQTDSDLLLRCAYDHCLQSNGVNSLHGAPYRTCIKNRHLDGHNDGLADYRFEQFQESYAFYRDKELSRVQKYHRPKQ